MILYYGITTYHFLCFALHKLIYHKNDEAVLFIPERINDATILKRNFEKAGIFNEIFLYKEIFFSNKSFTEDILNDSIKKSILLVEKYPYDFSSFSEINIAQDYFSLGIYLNIKKIKYNYFEDACGRLSTDDDLCEHIKIISKVRWHLIKKYRLLGNNKNVNNRYGDLSRQKEGYFNSKDVNFSVKKILNNMKYNDIINIAKLFCDKEISIDNNLNDTLLLSQHYINIGVLNYSEQEKLYKLVLDYFASVKFL